MVAPLTFNVCIMHHAVLNAIVRMCQTICDVTSGNVLKQKGRTGGDGLVYTVKTAWLCLGLAVKIPQYVISPTLSMQKWS